METRCHSCGSPVGAEQAFCPQCGAVVGMADAGAPRDEGELEATMMGQKFPSQPPPRTTQSHPAYAEAPQPAHAASAPAARGGNTRLLAVIGFVAVLLIGGLLLMLFYLNSQG